MFEAKGLDSATALDAAHRALASMLQHQSMALSFEDAYRFILIVLLVTLPLVLLLRKGAPGGVQATAGERSIRGPDPAGSIP